MYVEIINVVKTVTYCMKRIKCMIHSVTSTMFYGFAIVTRDRKIGTLACFAVKIHLPVSIS